MKMTLVISFEGSLSVGGNIYKIKGWMNMEREIDEVFKYDNVKLRVIYAPYCQDCYFKLDFPCLGKPHIEVTGNCEALLRKDNKSVSFIKMG